MFGVGCYFATHASKSDFYAKKSGQGTQCMILALVSLGNPYMTKVAMASALRAPDGFDSVVALSKDNGGAVDYPEYVVFKGTQALPKYRVYYRHLTECKCNLC